MTDSTPIASGWRIHGRVQGVGFRWWTRKTAESLGITGSVRNLPDGSVEVRASGPEDTLQEFARRLCDGPRSARVRRVESFSVAEIRRDSFSIEP
jgi:acylphosphatase